MKIRVEIAERPYSLNIKAEEEERIRRAAARIKSEIDKLKRTHEASLVEYLSMAALRISIENEENKERIASSPVTLRLQALTNQLDQWLEGNSAE